MTEDVMKEIFQRLNSLGACMSLADVSAWALANDVDEHCLQSTAKLLEEAGRLDAERRALGLRAKSRIPQTNPKTFDNFSTDRLSNEDRRKLLALRTLSFIPAGRGLMVVGGDRTGKTPRYPFGYGLSYTTFAISKPKYRKGVLTVKVKNTGERDGDEVVQVYVRNPKDTDGPLKTLRAFRRVRVKAGESADVSIALPRSTFELWDEETNTMRVVPGKYVLMAGNSSADEDLRKITVKVR